MLEGINSISDASPSLLIKEGIIGYYDWGMKSIGGVLNVSETLYPQKDPNYTNGQVWMCSKKGLIWESGIGALVSNDETYPGVSGIHITGVYYPVSTTGIYSHKIDHVNGRVIFDSPISTSLNVSINYSHKYCDVVPVDNFSSLLRLFEQRSGRELNGSGDYHLDPRSVNDLPLIGVEVPNNIGLRPYQLGGGQYLDKDVIFHCLGKTSEEADKLVDIVTMQNDKSIYVFDLDKIYSSGAFPVGYDGVPNSGALRYPELIRDYKHSKTLRFQNTRGGGQSSPINGVIHKSVRVSAELILNIL